MSNSESVVIYHNPACGTSRNVLALISAAGYTPTVIEYMQTGWTRPQLLGLFAAANLTPRDALRETKSPAVELGLLELLDRLPPGPFRKEDGELLIDDQGRRV